MNFKNKYDYCRNAPVLNASKMIGAIVSDSDGSGELETLRSQIERLTDIVGFMAAHLGGEMKLTPWFPGDVKPVRVGVYKRVYRIGDVGYCYWNGQIWSWRTTTTPTDALRLQDTRSLYQNLPWRGVMKLPSTPEPSSAAALPATATCGTTRAAVCGGGFGDVRNAQGKEPNDCHSLRRRRPR